MPGDTYEGLSATSQGGLYDLGLYNVLNMSGLSTGTYNFYFGIDTDMKGNLDLDKIYYDSVEVNGTQ